MTSASPDVTRLIHRIHGGDQGAREDLWTLVYDELRRLALGQMSRERVAHTLEPTALVHEAWLRLARDENGNIENRAHFFGVAAEAMRRILVEHARRRSTGRRGGGMQRLDVWDSMVQGLDDQALSSDLAALDQALERLAATGRHERKCQVVNLRFFVGLTNEQTAEVLGLSVSTVKRDWAFSKAWLTRDIGRAAATETTANGALREP
jgi:RNA polymerase sigma factor (TIGR02999 family)